MEEERNSPGVLSTKSKGSAKSLKSNNSGRASISVVLPQTSAEDLERDSPVHVTNVSPDRPGYLSRLSPEQQIQFPQDKNVSQKQYTSNRNASPLSLGTIPPQGTPTDSKLLMKPKDVQRVVAARIIERAWASYRDRQMFKLLKHAICAAENSLSVEILRKVAPKEAELLKDKSMQVKVRFRFGGWEFPPLIFFKVYSSVKGGMGVRYVSGKKMIQPATDAARDACERMGHRKFYDQFLQDTMQYETHKIVDEVDITTLKDYMQYLSLLDEMPAYMGGRDNTWRKLTLEVLPRATIFYDVVSFLYDGMRKKAMTPRLQSELPALLTKPMTEDVQLEHIRIISKLRSPEPTVLPSNTLKVEAKPNVSSRRSKRARMRVLKMRKTYENAKEEDESAPVPDEAEPIQGYSAAPGTAPETWGEEEEDWEEEADRLYEWTQGLCMNDIDTPSHTMLST